MPREKDLQLQFLPLIKETFGKVLDEYGFEIQGEVEWDGHGEYSLTTSTGDMELIFYLGLPPLFYYFDIGIKLLGELAKKATPDSYYQKHSVGVMEIASHIDPNYKVPLKASQTKQELIEAMERGKEDLLQYCNDILLGNVSVWSEVVSELVEQRKKSGIKIEGYD